MRLMPWIHSRGSETRTFLHVSSGAKKDIVYTFRVVYLFRAKQYVYFQLLIG
jgi:hypothetical protein